MKITAAAVLASCTPSLGFALDGSGWSIAKVPSVGLSDVTFPFNITNAPHKTGYFFAQQFNFNGQSNNGYTGLQPRPDSGGKPIIHAVSTSFVAGTTTNDPTATLGLMVVLV
ncbi:hypothetical protein BG003_002052 [Podila horticola]|nr:hypothetical protein BG003_002052 [Podila horticola]